MAKKNRSGDAPEELETRDRLVRLEEVQAEDAQELGDRVAKLEMADVRADDLDQHMNERLDKHRDRISKLERDLGNLSRGVVAELMADRTAAAEERKLDKRIEKVEWQQMKADSTIQVDKRTWASLLADNEKLADEVRVLREFVDSVKEQLDELKAD